MTQAQQPTTNAHRATVQLIPARREPIFSLGKVCATPGLIDALRENAQNPLYFLARHVKGDWSEMDEHDQQENTHALTNGTRIFSSYRMKNGQKLYVITEADRSVTTLLLPSEY